MQVKKAVITAAGERQRRLPLQTLVDRDGVNRTVLAILVNEILHANIEEVCVVVRPGDEEAYREAVPEHLGLLRFIPQREALGYGHALFCAREFVAGQSFLHLVGDHVYASRDGDYIAARVVEVAKTEVCAISAVQATREGLLGSFGVVGGQPVRGSMGLYRVETVLEKPTPTLAEQRLIVPGMRAGYYLAFFGMHVLTPGVFEILDRLIREAAPQSRVTLSDALTILAGQERYLALQVKAQRYDLGPRYGLLTAQMALALGGRDREEVLSLLVGLLSSQESAKESQHA